VLQTATALEIRSKYKRLALMHHPDKQAGKTDAEARLSEELFREVQEAFDILSDPGISTSLSCIPCCFSYVACAVFAHHR
jgi:DnaJ-class molecular chaperone